MKYRSQHMEYLESMMKNTSLNKTQMRGALLEYFHHTGDTKLPAIW